MLPRAAQQLQTSHFGIAEVLVFFSTVVVAKHVTFFLIVV